MTQLLGSCLVAMGALACWPALADEQADVVVPEATPLSQDDMRQITVTLLERYPQLAGSPGVKVSSSYLSTAGTDGATVIYFPHLESRGMKTAFEAYCHRTHPSTVWICDEVRNRRYLQVASQDFEVRILADISSDAALALIEASRRDLSSNAVDVSTAVLIQDHHEEPGRYFVTWGTPEGFSKVTMLAQLTRGGNPANPDDWHASVFEPPPIK